MNRRFAVIGLLSLLALASLADAGAVRWERPKDGAATAVTLDYLASLDEGVTPPKVWVHFTDKSIFDGETYHARCAEVAGRLDEHAAARRFKALGHDLVDFYDLPLARDYIDAIQNMGAAVFRESRWLNAVSVRAPLPRMREIAALPFVQKLVPVGIGRANHPLPSDGRSAPPPARGARDLFDYGQSRDQMDEIGIVAAHELGLSGAGVRVTMMDTGYWRDHPTYERLLSEGRLLAQWDFINDDGETQDEPGDPEGQHNHGTTTWSLIGGFTEGELIGTAYGADFLLAKTEDTSGEDPIEEDNWVAGMEWADGHGADIISSSLNYIAWYQYSDMDGNTATTTIAADIAASRGIVVCSAAGNWGTQDWFYIGAPADADSILAVGASEPDGSMWLDSSHGPTYDGRTKPEVVARGSVTYAAVVPGGHGGPDPFRTVDGTSVSCPLVAGSAALLLEAHPNWTHMQVREALMMTADNAQSPDNHRGWGRIDVMAALSYGVSGIHEGNRDQAGGLTITPNPAGGALSVLYRIPAWISVPPTLEILSGAGRLVYRYELRHGGAPVEWDGRDLRGRRVAPGVYLARLKAGAWQKTKKLIIAR